VFPSGLAHVNLGCVMHLESAAKPLDKAVQWGSIRVKPMDGIEARYLIYLTDAAVSGLIFAQFAESNSIAAITAVLVRFFTKGRRPGVVQCSSTIVRSSERRRMGSIILSLNRLGIRVEPPTTPARATSVALVRSLRSLLSEIRDSGATSLDQANHYLTTSVTYAVLKMAEHHKMSEGLHQGAPKQKRLEQRPRISRPATELQQAAMRKFFESKGPNIRQMFAQAARS
jgi:hypothetical protein